MKALLKLIPVLLIAVPGSLFLYSFRDTGVRGDDDTGAGSNKRFPYKQAGLTKRQAAAHLLSRFTFGERPGQVDAVVRMGLENWFRQQLEAALPDDSLERLLSGYDALKLSNGEIVATYPKGFRVARMAMREGFLPADSAGMGDRKEYRQKLLAYMQEKGYKPEQELIRQFECQKILRAVYGNNQLQEVMTDFWFNHFNVSFTKNDCSQFIPNYERDVIRPHALGSFETLLVATAKSPAMLLYLDNFISSGPVPERPAPWGNTRRMQMAARGSTRVGADGSVAGDSSGAGGRSMMAGQRPARAGQGLNENYAREVMELHTLGVNGGYTQEDVTEAARALTGWTLFPTRDSAYGGGFRKLLEGVGEDRLASRGFVHEGDFLFVPNRHDQGAKKILGEDFPAGGGYEEGLRLLHLLAHHPSTAKFIARQIAVRFVNDDPAQGFVDKLATAFTKSDGDIRQVLTALVEAPEFWQAASLRAKTKSPFELAVSAVRGLDASVDQPIQLYNWINRMGQKIYYYQAPTGFPDRGQYWINTGSLLSRMNFGLALACNRIPGVHFDLLALNKNHEPESAEAALPVYCQLMMPERPIDANIRRLTPLLKDPALEQKLKEAGGKEGEGGRGSGNERGGGNGKRTGDGAGDGTGYRNESAGGSVSANMDGSEAGIGGLKGDESGGRKEGRKGRGGHEGEDGNMSGVGNEGRGGNAGVSDNGMLGQVVGIIIGSPEFQHR